MDGLVQLCLKDKLLYHGFYGFFIEICCSKSLNQGITVIKGLFEGYKNNLHSAESEDYKKYRNAAKVLLTHEIDIVEASLHAVRRTKGNSKEYE